MVPLILTLQTASWKQPKNALKPRSHTTNITLDIWLFVIISIIGYFNPACL